jgi:hypothetical protein
MDVIQYTPAPTIREFIKTYRKGELFYNWIIGPVGSGKTSGIFFKLVYMAGLQAPAQDGVRRTRAVVIRNTAPQLKDTTLASWNLWFKDGQAGDWRATEKNFTLRYQVGNTPVECEVLFRPLDTPDDVARVLSLEVTFVIIDEFVQLPKEIIEALSARCGRYPSMKDGGPTNFGMWGSSNPDTEDVWWYDYLTNNPHVEFVRGGVPEDLDVRRMRRAMLGWDLNDLDSETERANVTYFIQPSALSPGAENLPNLNGGAEFYKNLIIGKSKAWIKQFVDAEWGFSVAGTPVVGTFKPEVHIAKGALKFNPNLPLVVGCDPGLAGSALIFGQQSLDGQLSVLGELVQQGYGAERLITERLKPYLRLRFPNAKVIIAPDPAANSRSDTDERTIVSVFKRHYDVSVETNNRLPLRLDAIEHFTTKLLEIGPALQIDARHCPVLIRALKGGWRWETKPKKADTLKKEVDGNAYSHPGDGFGYLARYFYKRTERETRYGVGAGNKPFVPPRNFGAKSYHFT